MWSRQHQASLWPKPAPCLAAHDMVSSGGLVPSGLSGYNPKVQHPHLHAQSAGQGACLLSSVVKRGVGEGGSPGVKKPGPQSWLSAFACCLTLVQAPTLSESPFSHLQNGSDGQRRYLRESGRPLVQVNCSMTLVPYPMVSETPPNLQATQQQTPAPAAQEAPVSAPH